MNNLSGRAVDLVLSSLNNVNSENKKTLKEINVALVGLGPHAKRIYLNYLRKHKMGLSLLIELESNKQISRKYLDENGFKRTKIFTIDNEYKDLEHLPVKVADNLLAVFKTLEITHLLISTEPKAHNMYIEFGLKNNIHTLTDKPITVTKNMTSLRSIEKVRKQYYDIVKLAENSSAMCKVMCQRQYHKGYEYIKNLLNEVVSKYQMPITYIDIYHCDGNWEMPHDLEKENHPYKYGYGKLFHSGYHFIDLLSDFLKINMQLKGTKRITKGEVSSRCFTPNDEINVFNIEDYKRIFKNQDIPDYYFENDNPKFKKYGEKNFYGLLEFRNKNNQIITNANLNLLHYGFSRRGWIESKDYYKNNGRIRHERINIQVGPLLNIQVHSYQSKEIKDRDPNNLLEEQVGGLEHFDIDIYRNVDVIGGKPFERISLGSLYTDKERKEFLGYNELSREVYLTNFFKGKCDKGDIKDQALAIEILYSCAKGIHNYYNNKEITEKINVCNEYTYPFIAKRLKGYSNKSTINLNKKEVLSNIYHNSIYTIYNFMKYVPSNSNYEVFISIDDTKNVVGSLLFKTFKYKFMAYIYYKHIEYIANYKKITYLEKQIEKTN